MPAPLVERILPLDIKHDVTGGRAVRSGLLQRLDRLRNHRGATFEFAFRVGVIARLGAALDLREQVSERHGPELAARALQRVRGALRAIDIALGHVVGERFAEAGDAAFELGNEAGQQIIATARFLDEPNLRPQFRVHQAACHDYVPPSILIGLARSYRSTPRASSAVTTFCPAATTVPLVLSCQSNAGWCRCPCRDRQSLARALRTGACDPRGAGACATFSR